MSEHSMRHDYDLPPDWPGMTAAERNEWLTAERARRQARRQDTSTARILEKAQDRFDRRADALPGTVHLGNAR